MQQLTGLDAAFLALETATTTGHVGGVCLLDPKGAPTAPFVVTLGRPALTPVSPPACRRRVITLASAEGNIRNIKLSA